MRKRDKNRREGPKMNLDILAVVNRLNSVENVNYVIGFLIIIILVIIGSVLFKRHN